MGLARAERVRKYKRYGSAPDAARPIPKASIGGTAPAADRGRAARAGTAGCGLRRSSPHPTHGRVAVSATEPGTPAPRRPCARCLPGAARSHPVRAPGHCPRSAADRSRSRRRIADRPRSPWRSRTARRARVGGALWGCGGGGPLALHRAASLRGPRMTSRCPGWPGGLVGLAGPVRSALGERTHGRPGGSVGWNTEQPGRHPAAQVGQTVEDAWPGFAVEPRH